MSRIGKLIAAIAAGTLLTFAALAAVKVTEKPLGWRVLPPSTTAVPAFKTKEECVAAATARGAGDYTCEYTTTLKVEATCTDPKPEIKAVVNAEGFLVLPELKVDALANGEWGPTQEQGYVAAPYPTCWTLGWVPYSGEWHAPDGPPSQDVGPMVYCIDYGSIAHPPVGKACPATAKGGCYIPPNAPDVCPVP